MATRPVRVATRASALARWQADHVASLLTDGAGVVTEIVPVSTEGDRRTDVPLSSIGGKGVFSKEVQRAVLDGRADLAVHSAKDLPALTPPGLVIAAIPPRADPRDALVGLDLQGMLDASAAGEAVVVATGSARRRVQIEGLVPGVSFAELRGNMATRLEQAPRFAAIVVAAAALQRLDLADRISEIFDVDVLVPQVGQGALAVECRQDDHELREVLPAIDDPLSRMTVSVERAFLAELGGDCSLPAGAHCTVGEATLRIEGILADSIEPGACLVRGSATRDLDSSAVDLGDVDSVDLESLGAELARSLRTAVDSVGGDS